MLLKLEFLDIVDSQAHGAEKQNSRQANIYSNFEATTKRDRGDHKRACATHYAQYDGCVTVDSMENGDFAAKNRNELEARKERSWDDSV